MLETTLRADATALETKLKIERVSRVFGGHGKTVPVLDSVSMEAKEGVRAACSPGHGAQRFRLSHHRLELPGGGGKSPRS